MDTQNTQYTQDTQPGKNIAVRVDDELYEIVKKAAHRREMTLAQFVRTTLKEAADFYVTDDA